VTRNRRQARTVGAVGFLLAVTPWALIVLGLLFLVPVALSAGRDPESRWYPRARNAHAGWGISLYLLGVILGSQVAQLYSLSAP
jgi:hypothetical protein